MIHDLKIKYEFAKLHFEGRKDWEIRKNDRDFKVGDLIKFKITEFSNSTEWSYERKITHVFEDTNFGLEQDYVILSLSK
jgi:DNA-directed RNA polymerase subunit E'/Rpb7